MSLCGHQNGDRVCNVETRSDGKHRGMHQYLVNGVVHDNWINHDQHITSDVEALDRINQLLADWVDEDDEYGLLNRIEDIVMETGRKCGCS